MYIPQKWYCTFTKLEKSHQDQECSKRCNFSVDTYIKIYTALKPKTYLITANLFS